MGGTFQHVPACTAATDIALRDRLLVVPERTARKRRSSDGPNSPLLGGSVPPGMRSAVREPDAAASRTAPSGTLLPVRADDAVPGHDRGRLAGADRVDAVGADDRHRTTAQCKHENGATWLNVAFKEGVSQPSRKTSPTHNEVAEELIGPEWGLHLYDVNIALGNLVNTVAIQTQAYGFEH